MDKIDISWLQIDDRRAKQILIKGKNGTSL
jgi:hypothetical protein